MGEYPHTKSLTDSSKCFQSLPDSEEQKGILLNTFRDFPQVPVCEVLLASNGFYFTGIKDRVVCSRCSVEVENFCSGDDYNLRKFHKSDCIYSKESPRINMSSAGSILTGGQNNTQQARRVISSFTSSPISNETSFKPDANTMENPNKRWLSFHNHFNRWRSAYKHKLRVQDFVDAGFYYTGENDCVKCYSCKRNVRAWEKEDNDAWEVHKQFSPNCQHLQKHLNSRSLSNNRHDIKQINLDLPYSLIPSRFDVPDS